MTNPPVRGAVFFGRPSLLPSDKDGSAYFAGGNLDVIGHPELQPTTAITLEAWVTPTYGSLASQEVKIISNGTPWSAPYEAYILGLVHGAPMLSLVLNGTPKRITSPMPLSYGVPHHLIATYDGANMRMWVDGQLMQSVAAHGTISHYTNAGLGIGADIAQQWVYRGMMDEVAIYNHALSAGSITLHEAASGALAKYPVSVLSSQPISYYRLNEAVGPTAFDATLHDINGLYNKQVLLGQPGLSGTLSPIFEGGSVQIARQEVQFPRQEISVEAVVHPNAGDLFSNEVKLVSAGTPWSAPFESYKLSLVHGHPAWQIATSKVANQLVAGGALSTNAIYHLVATYNGANMALYVNGQLVKQRALHGNIYPWSGSGVAISADIAQNWLYRGALSDIALYAKALDANTIAQHAALLNLLPQIQASPTPEVTNNLSTPTPTPTAIATATPTRLTAPSPTPTSSSAVWGIPINIGVPIILNFPTPVPSPTQAPSATPTPTANTPQPSQPIIVKPVSTPTPTPSPTPTPTPRVTSTPGPQGSIQLSTSAVSLINIGNVAKIGLSERNYSRGWTQSSTCSGIASIALNTTTLSVTSLAAGRCQITVKDLFGQSAVVQVTSTITALTGQ